MKRAFGLLLLLAPAMAAAGWSGKYALTMTPASGRPVPVFLTLYERGQEISGSIAFESEARPVPIEHVQRHGDLLIFSAPNSANHVGAFRLTATVCCFGGEATFDGQTFKVSLSPTERPDGYWVGPGVSPPKLIYRVEPEYTEEARQAKVQGTVLLYAQIGPDGRAAHMRVLHGLGMGLDVKAMAAVANWGYEPAMKNGQPMN